MNKIGALINLKRDVDILQLYNRARDHRRTAGEGYKGNHPASQKYFE